ncbi:hypothetical protein ABK040_005868 [Willaertia magna]
MVTSCGLLIESKGKYLLCHTTSSKYPPKQPISPNKTDEKWTIPKGIIDEKDFINTLYTQKQIEIETAIRELQEETGIDLKNNEKLKKEIYERYVNGELDIPLYKIYKIKSKSIKVYLLKDENGLISDEYPLEQLKCSSLIDIEHFLKGYPEVDAFIWVTKQEAYKIALKSQKVLFQ